MKWLLSIIFLLLFTQSFSQRKPFSFAYIDAKASNIDADSPDTLAQLLTAPYTTELEKVRSIFYWIADHISYNTIRYRPQPVAYKDDGYESAHDADSVLKPLNERISEIVLKRRFALCDGYARLFKTLCDAAGIKSEVINGYSRTNFGSGQFSCNHKWNAVMIDSIWYLLDATWASGYLNFSGTNFIKDYNDAYFLMPPKYFVQYHYPDDIKWTLLSDPPTLAEFNRSPFKQPAFNYRIVSFTPSKGIIDATVGDTIKVTLETIDDNKNLCLLDLSSLDSSNIFLADSIAKTNRNFTIKDNKIIANYIVSNQAAQWLQVIYNGNVVLRYKLNIKQPAFPYLPLVIKDIALNN